MRFGSSLLAFVLGFPLCAQEEGLRLTALFGDHMVLPAKAMVTVRGNAAKGAEVALTASWLDAPLHGKASDDGAFALSMPTPSRGGPHRFVVRSGSAERAVEDVLAGDVWLASGQSNMEMSLGPSPTGPKGCDEWERDAAAADLPQLRLFTVTRRVAAAPLADVEGEWRVCTPETAKAFSATAFYFGADLARRDLGPIGVVASSWGGTVCEAWTQASGLREFPEFTAAIDDLANSGGEAAVRARRAFFWKKVENAAGTADAFVPVSLPHVWSKQGLEAHDGLGTYRREIEVPTAWSGAELVLMLGAIDDMDVVLWDGKRVASTEVPGHWNEARQYRVPATSVTAGTHRLEVVVVDTGGEGGIGGSAEACRLAPVNGDAGALALDAGWTFARGPALRELPRFPDSLQSNPNVPTVLWNGMVAGLLPFPFTGAIWYQGESNRGRAVQYATLFPAMIRAWRAAIGTELPFVFVQIAPFGYANDTGEAFALRLAQEAALGLPKVGMAVTTDVGDPADIHPRDKRTVGERLAMQARHLHYGEAANELLPPRVAGATAEGAEVRLRFTGVQSFRARSAMPQHFELAGEDQRFAPARVRVDGSELVLAADGIGAPRHVRYAFAATAMADLVDQRGLPLPPFVVEVAAKGR